MSNHIGTMSLGNTPKHTQETPSTQLDSFSNSTSQIESLEKDTYERKTTQETIRLKSSVETMQYGDNQLVTLEALKDTPLKETMLSVLAHQDFDQVPVLQNKSPEQRVEFLFRKINIGLTRFYARKLNLNPDQGVPPYLEKVVLPATECFLMDLLRKTGQETNINFLGSLSQMSFDKIGQLFEDIKAFSEKFTLPFSQAKALLNLSDFLALPKNRARLENLTSPYEFYEKVMKHPLWTKEFVSEPVKANEQEKKVNIYELRWEDFGLDSTSAQLSDEEKQQHLETEKEKIKEEL